MDDWEWLELTPTWSNKVQRHLSVAIVPDKNRVKVLRDEKYKCHSLVIVDGNLYIPVAQSPTYIESRLK